MRTPQGKSGVLAVLVAMLTAGGCGNASDISMDETELEMLFEALGQGPAAAVGDEVCIDYRVKTTANEELLWGKDFCFRLGAGATILGIDESVPGMREGGRRTVKCPAHMHWGRNGYGGKIPPKSSLIIELRLTSIEPGRDHG